MFSLQNIPTFLAAFFFLTTLSAISPTFQEYFKYHTSLYSASPYQSVPTSTCSTTMRDSRFPPLTPSELNPEQQKTYKALDDYNYKLYGSSNLKLKNKDGAYIGPFLPLMYTPSTTLIATQLTQAAISNPLLSPRERELAILAALSWNRPIYALYAHTQLALDAGLTQEQVIDAREGRLPSGIGERERASYEFVLAVVKVRGPLGEEEFEKARRVMGRDGAAALMHVAGVYLYSGLLMNAADVCLPEGETL